MRDILPAAGQLVGLYVGTHLPGSFGNRNLLGAVGSMLGGGFGAMAGGTRQTFVSGKLDDRRLQGSAAGVPIPLIFGRIRVASTIIWTTGLREVQTATGGGGKRPRNVNYTYFVSCAHLLAQNEIQSVRKIMNGSDVIFDGTVSPARYDRKLSADRLRIYLGTEDQAADPTMVDHIGAANCPAFRGFAYVVLEEVEHVLLDNLNFEVDGGPTDLEVICVALSEMGGLSSSQVDFSALAGVAVNGLTFEAAEVADALSELAGVYMFDLVEYDRKLRAVPRGQSPSFSIDLIDCGHGIQQAAASPMKTVRTSEWELPYESLVSYTLPASGNFQAGTQSATRPTRDSVHQVSVRTGAVLTDDQARRLAAARLYASWAERGMHSTSVPWRFLAITPGDVGTIHTPGGPATVRVLEASPGLIGPISLSLVEQDPRVYQQYVLGAGSAIDPGIVNVAGEPDWAVLDLPNWVSDSDSVCVTTAASSDVSGWEGGSIDSDGTDGWPQNVSEQFSVKTPMGRTLGSLPPARAAQTDWSNFVDVSMEFGELESISEAESLSGRNLAAIGSEIVSFQRAVLVGTGVYRLTGILRGLFGTEWATSSHTSGEAFVLLRDGMGVRTSAQFNSYNEGQIGTTLMHRLVESGVDYSAGFPDLSSTSVLGNSRRPWAPVLSCERSGADVEISWNRRARRNNSFRDSFDVPLDESLCEFRLQIWDASESTVLRTEYLLLADAGLQTWTYSAAMQVADLGSSSIPFVARLAQVGRTPLHGLEIVGFWSSCAVSA